MIKTAPATATYRGFNFNLSNPTISAFAILSPAQLPLQHHPRNHTEVYLR